MQTVSFYSLRQIGRLTGSSITLLRRLVAEGCLVPDYRCSNQLCFSAHRLEAIRYNIQQKRLRRK